MVGMTAYRYAVRDDTGRQVLTHAMSAEKVSDVRATLAPTPAGQRVTLWNADRAAVVVTVAPELTGLHLWRYPLDGSGDPVIHTVTDEPAGTLEPDSTT